MGAPNRPAPEELILAALAHAPLAPGAKDAGVIAATLRALGVVAIPRDADDYPAGFAALADPPAVVFRLGAALPGVAESIAIVGSRAATPYGLRIARRLAGDLAAAGITVVSGLARGIDAAAHEAALAAGGRTVAVLPSGLDAIAPAHHVALAHRIAAAGSLVSERASGPPPHRATFVERNRLIAALAAVTVVVEASVTSGALHTARAAQRLGRVVMAVPGDVDRVTALGAIGLLAAGATPCVTAADVLYARDAWLAGASPKTRARGARAMSAGRPRGAGRRVVAAAPDGGSPEQRLRAALAGGARPVEQIAAAAGLAVAETLARLLALEWAGFATRLPGGRWRAGRER